MHLSAITGTERLRPDTLRSLADDRTRGGATTAPGGGTTVSAQDSAYSSNTGWLVAITGRPSATEPALAGAIVDRGAAAVLTEALAGGWRQCLALLRGNFSLVAAHESSGITVAAIDRIGIGHLYYAPVDGGLVVATSLAELVALLPGPPAINLQALYEYVYFHVLPSPGTIWQGVSKLSSAHYVVCERGKVTTGRYWTPRFATESMSNADEAALHLARTLEGAVSRSLPPQGDVACFLSGGLDSSSVTGLAARLRGGPAVHAFTIGFDIPSYDESAYARMAVDRFRVQWHRKELVPDDLLGCLASCVTAFDEPFGNSSGPAVYHCARAAREAGFSTIIAGDGGDELFGGNERYAKQLVFERYLSLPAAFRSSLFEPMLRAVTGVTTAWPLGKAASYVRQANVPLPDRLQTYNFLHQHRPSEVFDPSLLTAVDAERPLRLLREEYAAAVAGGPVNRMLLLDWKFTLHDNDLVKVNSMCRHAGIEVEYPMLDAELLELSLSMPDNVKVRNGELRWLYKRATRDLLPEGIIQKKKHGFGLPFGLWMRTDARLMEIATESLRSLEKRGWFRREFLDEAVRQHREGHAAYFGELIWILTALELWLQHHSPSAALAAR